MDIDDLICAFLSFGEKIVEQKIVEEKCWIWFGYLEYPEWRCRLMCMGKKTYLFVNLLFMI